MSCSECFSGSVHDGTPKGSVTKLHGLDVYVSGPGQDKQVKGIIIIISDAFGWEFINNRILADHYAEKGSYKVYLPDFMKGYAAPIWAATTIPKLLSSSWLAKPYYFITILYAMVPFMIFNHFGKSWPLVKSFFTAVRKNEGASLPIGAAGFCWGGKHAVNLAHGYQSADGKKPLIDAGFTGHPSNLVIPDEIAKIKKPVSFAIGDKDVMLKTPQIEQIKKVVEEKSGEERGEVKIYHGASHGFCVRADHILTDSEQQALQAEEQCISWFDQHFHGISY